MRRSLAPALIHHPPLFQQTNVVTQWTANRQETFTASKPAVPYADARARRFQLIEFFAMYEVCTVVMEACAGSHHMARKLASFGHEVKLISSQFVRPFVKSNKNDFVDAEAICEAAARPAMRFLTPKTESQQTLSVLHRVRESMVRDRTRTTNQMDGFLLESGVRLPVGKTAVARLPEFLDAQALPPRLIAILERLHEHLKYLEKQIGEIERERAHQLADDDVGQRLMSITGIGRITASVLAAEMGNGRQYGCSRDFAASVGLVPRQYSTGGRSNLVGISRRGDKHVRCLLVLCARAYLTLIRGHRARQLLLCLLPFSLLVRSITPDVLGLCCWLLKRQRRAVASGATCAVYKREHPTFPANEGKGTSAAVAPFLIVAPYVSYH